MNFENTLAWFRAVAFEDWLLLRRSGKSRRIKVISLLKSYKLARRCVCARGKCWYWILFMLTYSSSWLSKYVYYKRYSYDCHRDCKLSSPNKNINRLTRPVSFPSCQNEGLPTAPWGRGRGEGASESPPWCLSARAAPPPPPRGSLRETVLLKISRS